MIQDATFKQLRSLSAVIRHGTVTAAADHLHLTAPAVGQQLKLLQRAVGHQLFDRTPQGLRPTDVGMELLKSADRIEDELERCAEGIEMLRSGKVGTVALGAVSTAKYFAPQLMGAFWHLHPDIDVRLQVGNRQETISALANHEIDMAIMGRPPGDLPLESAPLGPHPHVIIAAPSHPLTGARSVEPQALRDERFLLREPGSGTRYLAEVLLAAANVQPRIVMEIASNETIKQAAMAELGVALISAHTVAAELADGRLVMIDVEGTPIMRQWIAVRREASQHGVAASLLWEFLISQTRAHLPDVS